MPCTVWGILPCSFQLNGGKQATEQLRNKIYDVPDGGKCYEERRGRGRWRFILCRVVWEDSPRVAFDQRQKEVKCGVQARGASGGGRGDSTCSAPGERREHEVSRGPVGPCGAVVRTWASPLSDRRSHGAGGLNKEVHEQPCAVVSLPCGSLGGGVGTGAVGTEAGRAKGEVPRDESETSTGHSGAGSQTRESEVQVPAGDTRLSVIGLQMAVNP